MKINVLICFNTIKTIFYTFEFQWTADSCIMETYFLFHLTFSQRHLVLRYFNLARTQCCGAVGWVSPVKTILCHLTTNNLIKVDLKLRIDSFGSGLGLEYLILMLHINYSSNLWALMHG